MPIDVPERNEPSRIKDGPSVTHDTLLADSNFYYDPITCLPTNKELQYQKTEIGKYMVGGAVIGALSLDAAGAFAGSVWANIYAEQKMTERTEELEASCHAQRR